MDRARREAVRPGKVAANVSIEANGGRDRSPPRPCTSLTELCVERTIATGALFAVLTLDSAFAQSGGGLSILTGTADAVRLPDDRVADPELKSTSTYPSGDLAGQPNPDIGRYPPQRRQHQRGHLRPGAVQLVIKCSRSFVDRRRGARGGAARRRRRPRRRRDKLGSWAARDYAISLFQSSAPGARYRTTAALAKGATMGALRALGDRRHRAGTRCSGNAPAGPHHGRVGVSALGRQRQRRFALSGPPHRRRLHEVSLDLQAQDCSATSRCCWRRSACSLPPPATRKSSSRDHGRAGATSVPIVMVPEAVARGCARRFLAFPQRLSVDHGAGMPARSAPSHEKRYCAGSAAEAGGGGGQLGAEAGVARGDLAPADAPAQPAGPRAREGGARRRGRGRWRARRRRKPGLSTGLPKLRELRVGVEGR